MKIIKCNLYEDHVGPNTTPSDLWGDREKLQLSLTLNTLLFALQAVLTYYKHMHVVVFEAPVLV